MLLRTDPHFTLTRAFIFLQSAPGSSAADRLSLRHPVYQFIRRRPIQISHLGTACDHTRILRFCNPKPAGSSPRPPSAVQSPVPPQSSQSGNFLPMSSDMDSADRIRRFQPSPVSAQYSPYRFQTRHPHPPPVPRELPEFLRFRSAVLPESVPFRRDNSCSGVTSSFLSSFV